MGKFSIINSKDKIVPVLPHLCSQLFEFITSVSYWNEISGAKFYNRPSMIFSQSNYTYNDTKKYKNIQR
jgi:hypothetical protein